MEENSSSQNTKAGFALGLTIIGVFIPIVGIILTIIGLVLAHSVRKADNNNGMALAAMIIGYISLALALLVTLFVVMVGYQTWYATYQSALNTQIEQQSQTGSDISIERLEQDGRVYIKNSQTSQFNDVSVSVSGGECDEKSGVSIPPTSVESVSLTNCNLEEEQGYDVVVRADYQVFSESEIAR